MSKEILKFNDIEIEKRKFHSFKSPTTVNDIDIDKITISNKFPCGKKGFKYFIGYKNDKKVIPLCVLLPNLSGYVKRFDNTKCMFFYQRQTIAEKI